MPSISQSIITNVDDKYIETYLKKKGFARSEEERGQELKYWVDNLLSTGKLNVEDFGAKEKTSMYIGSMQ